MNITSVQFLYISTLSVSAYIIVYYFEGLFWSEQGQGDIFISILVIAPFL